ncbi:MAG: hypothetical protein AB7E42_03400 [Anaerotignaceae bacterium]
MGQSEIIELFNKMGLYCGDDKELIECFKEREGNNGSQNTKGI